MDNQKSLWISYLSLFSSVSTLLCCALPSLFVFLGMGAMVAGFISFVPQIVWVSEHKAIVFGVSGFLIFSSMLGLYLQRNAPCPVDPQQARACTVARRWSVGVTGMSFVLWCLGFIAAFILPLIVQ